MKQLFLAAATALAITGCTGPKDAGQETTPAPVMTRADSNLVVAESALRQDSSEENFIWYGRRLGYVQRMDDAIAAFTAGLEKYPGSWKLLRFRGHRYISTRQFARAIDDLKQAALLMKDQPVETEPDGEPNRLNIPLSTYQYNVWYHLGLGHYLTGDYENAIEDFRECLKRSVNDDLMVASCDWLYMSCRRAGDERTAKGTLSNVHDRMKIIENDAYYIRLRMYQGALPPDSVLVADPSRKDYDLSLATQGYGVGNWFWHNGEKDRARDIFTRITEGKSTFSFGYIAAETDLKRLW